MTTISGANAKFAFPWRMGNTTYEYDYFCVAWDTPILVRREEEKQLLFAADVKDGDEVISVNEKTKEQEWKRVTVTKRKAPSKKILKFNAGTSFRVTHTHRMLNPDFTSNAAGNYSSGDYLAAVDKINLPESLDRVSLSLLTNKKIDAAESISLNEKTAELFAHLFLKNNKIPCWVFSTNETFKRKLVEILDKDYYSCGSIFHYSVYILKSSINISAANKKEISDIEEVDYQDEFVYDFMVEDNHNFLIGDVISHNCGSQVLIYFEDVLIEDACRIGWTVNQNRSPIYGYASQYFNALAAGNIIAGGSLWIYFKEVAYMPTILRHVAQRKSADEANFYATPAILPMDAANFSTSLDHSARLYGGTASVMDFSNSSNRTDNDFRQVGRVRRQNIERILESRENNENSETATREMQEMLTSLGAMSDREFEDVAEIFEDAIWYGGNSGASGVNDDRGQYHQGNFAGGDIEDARWLGLRRADQYPPFDIVVTYGDMNNGAANHTVHRILDVTITSTEVAAVQASGEPLVVRYDFLARNAV